MNKKILKKFLIVVFLTIAIFIITSNMVLATTIVPIDSHYHSKLQLSPKGYLLTVLVISIFLLVPFFMLEKSFIKNQTLLEKTNDEATIKKIKKYQITITIWSTIILVLWLLFGTYIIFAANYYSIKPSTYAIVDFFIISLLIILLKIIYLIKFKKKNYSFIIHILIIVLFITYYLGKYHTFLYKIFESLLN